MGTDECSIVYRSLATSLGIRWNTLSTQHCDIKRRGEYGRAFSYLFDLVLCLAPLSLIVPIVTSSHELLIDLEKHHQIVNVIRTKSKLLHVLHLSTSKSALLLQYTDIAT